jgi:hypothetical protein
MRSPLTVRVDDGRVSRIVTRYATGLRFTKTAPGGHALVSMRLDLPPQTFHDLGPNDRVYVYDGRTGRTVIEGYTENPTPMDSPRGLGFDLRARGGMILAQDKSTPVVFIERSLDPTLWTRTSTMSGTSETPAGDRIRLQFPSGMPVGAYATAALGYNGLIKAGQRLLAFTTDTRAGKNDAGWSMYAAAYNDNTGLGDEILNLPFATTQTTSVRVAPTHFAATRNSVQIAGVRMGGATNVADDLTWVDFFPVIRPQLAAKDGSDAAARSYTLINPDEVVRHILGAMLPGCDGANARVDLTDGLIDQLAYHDGATPQRILDDLTLWGPDYLWEILEAGPNGKHRFNYRGWPTTPRYEIATSDGYSAVGGEMDLCNRIFVYGGANPGGDRRFAVLGQHVPELGNKNPVLPNGTIDPTFVGRVRDAPDISLPEGLASISNAAAIGAAVLASKATPPKAAKAVLYRPIVDMLTGKVVMPWEVEPGYVVRVRETGDDLRLTEVNYTDDSVSVELTLGEPQLTIEQRIAALSRVA